jgi:hypothetical protein
VPSGRVIRRALLLTLLAGAAGIVLLLPPRTLTIARAAGGAPVLRGAIHIHTTNSDGSGTPDEVAAAAARAGLSFVILTDHGDATRVPDRPRYHDGVLVIDAVEVSTSGGHVIALGLDRAPYPLRGEPADVLDDLARLGAMAIVAHPTSLKADLRWRDGERPVDGIEWLNVDSEWRDEPAWALARVLATYWFRPPESLALILDRPASALAMWDRVSRDRSVVGLGGADAHAMIGGDMDHGGPAALHLPSYEQVFRTFSIGLPGLALSKNADADARAVVAAIRAGHVFTAIDAFASPARLAFTARGEGIDAQGGDRIEAGRPAMLRAQLDAPALAPTLTLYRDGAVATTATGDALEFQTDGRPAVYRVEATLPVRRGDTPLVPWLVSNPIYVGPAQPNPPMATPPTVAARALYDDGASPFAIEQSARSLGALATVSAVGGDQVSMRYALGGAQGDAPFVAFAAPVSQLGEFTRVRVTGRASKPMRVSLQLRTGVAQGSERWRRSIFFDTTAQTQSVGFSNFVPVRPGLAPQPPLADIATLLFVVDTMNTALGSNGEFWIHDVVFER